MKNILTEQLIEQKLRKCQLQKQKFSLHTNIF